MKTNKELNDYTVMISYCFIDTSSDAEPLQWTTKASAKNFNDAKDKALAELKAFHTSDELKILYRYATLARL